MRTAGCAVDLFPDHPERAVNVLSHHDIFCGLIKAGPATAGIEFRFRSKQRRIADDAMIHSTVIRIVILAGKRPFGAFFLGDMKLCRRQALAEFCFGKCFFVVHNIHSCHYEYTNASLRPARV